MLSLIMERYTTTITITIEDYNRIKAWQNARYGQTLIGTVHEIIDTALKHKKNTHQNPTTKRFDGKGK